MTTATTNRIAALRALADHLDEHGLADDITSIRFDDVFRAGLIVHVHHPATVAAWVRSAANVEAFGQWYGANVHLHITVGELAGVPVSVFYATTQGTDRALIGEFRSLVPDEPVFGVGEPIDLPAALGGAA